MTYPNSPMDPKPEVWGWPWHGLIEGSGTFSGTLKIDDERSLTCRYLDYNNTSLWDIGLSDPEIETDDPHELWLGKAIIRSALQGDNVYAAAYGQRSYPGTYPFYVEGHGTLQRDFDVAPDRITKRVRLAGYVLAPETINLEPVYIPFSSLAPPEVLSAYADMSVEVLDNSPDGRRSLYAGYFFTTGAWASISPVIFEIELLGDPESGFALELHVVAPHEVAWSSARYPLSGDQGDFLMARWFDGSETKITRRSEVPAGITPIASWPVGVETAHGLLECPVWAWYATGGVEVIRYQLEVQLVRTFSGDEISRSEAGEETHTTRLIRGGDTVSLVSARIFERHSVGGSEVSAFTDHYANGEYLFREPQGPSDIPPGEIFPEQPPSMPLFSANSRLPTDVASLSNKILCPARGSLRIAPGSFAAWYGDAITPAGVDSGVHKMTHPTNAAFRRGCFNPITGQVVRNNPDKYQVWV